MKKIILASVLLLSGCQTASERLQDWKIACIEATVQAHSNDIRKVVSVLSSGSLVSSGSLTSTEIHLPPPPEVSSQGREQIGEVLEQTAKVAPLIPAPFGVAIAGILAILSGLFKKDK